MENKISPQPSTEQVATSAVADINRRIEQLVDLAINGTDDERGQAKKDLHYATQDRAQLLSKRPRWL